MNRILIQADYVASIQSSGSGSRHVRLELNMTPEQQRFCVGEILSKLTDAEVKRWIQADFPELFEGSDK